MYFGRALHGNPLSTGQVFLSGGYTNLNGQNQPLKRVEVYNPGLANSIDVIKYDMQVLVGDTRRLLSRRVSRFSLLVETMKALLREPLRFGTPIVEQLPSVSF